MNSSKKTSGDQQGCSDCRCRGLAVGTFPRCLAGDRSGYRLFRCDVCGAYWEDTIHHPHVITGQEARRVYPQAFS